MDKAKHAYGSRKNLDAAIASGAVDAYDVLFLNGEGESPAIGWVDKNKNPIIIEGADLSGIEAEIATKADSAELTELETQLENQIATKADSTEVDAKINTAMSDSVAASKNYTDEHVGNIMKEVDTKIAESIGTIEVIEF